MISRPAIKSSWPALIVLSAALRVGAADFGFSASAPARVAVSNTLTYSFFVTNTSGFVITNAFLTNQVAYPLTGTNSPGWVPLNSNTLVFLFTNLLPLAISNVTRAGDPIVSGMGTNTLFWTNTATLVGPSALPITTNLVTEIVIPRSDLRISLAVPTNVVVNDLISLEVTVANLGPETAPNVVVTNFLPTSFKFLGLTPASLTWSLTNDSIGTLLTVQVGALTNNNSVRFHVQVQPTNAGPFDLELVARVVASPVLETNLTNNVVVITNYYVSPMLPGELEVSLVSTQRFNPQTGLMEQMILLSNTGSTAVVSARVGVAGLTNWLFNASGTNDYVPFVAYGGPLATGESVTMLLKFFVPTRRATQGFTLSAVEVPLFIPPAPVGPSVPIARFVHLGPGQTVIEFPATNGQSYTVVYGDDADLSNGRASLPAIVAPANRVHWIDDGPPATSPALTNVAARFYRVILNQ